MNLVSRGWHYDNGRIRLRAMKSVSMPDLFRVFYRHKGRAGAMSFDDIPSFLSSTCSCYEVMNIMRIDYDITFWNSGLSSAAPIYFKTIYDARDFIVAYGKMMKKAYREVKN